MKAKITLIALLLTLPGSSALAQQYISLLTYNVGIPVGDTEDYISDISWLGFTIEGRRFRDYESRVTWGLSLSWQVLWQTETSTFTIQDLNTTVTGNQRRYINSFPLLLTGHVYLGPDDGFQLYVGGGAGIYYIIQRFEIGVYAAEENNFHFGLAPEVGFMFPLGSSKGTLSARFNYAFASGESVSGESIDYSYIAILAGFAWTRW